VRDGDGRKAPVIYDSHHIVCQIGPWKWDIEEFCTHWLITGDTGAGKTSSGLNRLLISLTEHYPRWGGLILDPKSVYWRTVQTIMNTAGGSTSSPSSGSGLRKKGSSTIPQRGSI
jgi:ABC-type molybdenum transport system ATPase subunit/photorepair protein PhrA